METEDPRSYRTCPRSHSQDLELGFELRSVRPQILLTLCVVRLSAFRALYLIWRTVKFEDSENLKKWTENNPEPEKTKD